MDYIITMIQVVIWFAAMVSIWLATRWVMEKVYDKIFPKSYVEDTVGALTATILVVILVLMTIAYVIGKTELENEQPQQIQDINP